MHQAQATVRIGQVVRGVTNRSRRSVGTQSGAGVIRTTGIVRSVFCS